MAKFTDAPTDAETLLSDIKAARANIARIKSAQLENVYPELGPRGAQRPATDDEVLLSALRREWSYQQSLLENLRANDGGGK